MNLKNLVFTLTAAVVISLMLLLSAAPAFADNPILPRDSNGNVTFPPITTTTPATNQPAAPPPPPPAVVSTTTTPSTTMTRSAPYVPPTGSTSTGPVRSYTLPSATADATGHHRPYDNNTPPRPPHPHTTHPHTTWPNNGYYPGSWPYNQYYSWSSDYPWVGTYPYPAVPDYQQPQPVYYVPVISSFTANPNYIQTGQLATLSWNVSNADLVSISPSVGSVAGTGSFSVIPAYTTTYTLTASNSQGNVTATATVTVAPYAATYGRTYGTGNAVVPGTTGADGYPAGSEGSAGSALNTSGIPPVLQLPSISGSCMYCSSVYWQWLLSLSLPCSSGSRLRAPGLVQARGPIQ